MLKTDSKHSGDKNYALNAVQNTVMALFNVPQESKYCFCDICLQNYELKEKGKQFLKQSSSVFNIDVSKTKKFYQFISSLDPKIYFKLQIPDLCFFQGGQGKLLFKSKATGIAQVQITPQFRKQIPNFFLDSKKTNPNLNSNFGQNKFNHIKHFQSVVPSFKHGLSNDNLDNRPKNYTFHSNQKNDEDNNQGYKNHQNAAAQVAIIKYKDKNLELVSEKQLRNIIKSNVKTQNIELIQGFIRPHQKQSQFIFSQFVEYRKPDNVLMYNRSLIQMKTEIGLLTKFSKEFIPLDLLEDYEQMLKAMPEEYCLYQTYKMIHYMEINRDIRIKHLTTVWFKDQMRELAFFGVAHFEYEENQKITADISNIVELKSIMKTQLTQLEQQLLGVWQNMKKRKMKNINKNVNSQEESFLKEIQMIKNQSKTRSMNESHRKNSSSK